MTKGKIQKDMVASNLCCTHSCTFTSDVAGHTMVHELACSVYRNCTMFAGNLNNLVRIMMDVVSIPNIIQPYTAIVLQSN